MVTFQMENFCGIMLKALVVSTMLAGCAFNENSQSDGNGGSLFGYTIGSIPREDSIKDISIPRVKSNIQAEEPHLQMEVTNLIIDKFTKELTYNVVPTDEEAEGILDITLTELRSSAVTYADAGTRWNQASAPSEYRVQLLASVKMIETSTSNIVWEAKKVRGKYDYVMSEDYQLIRREAIRQAARDLGQQILQTATERW